MKFDIKELLDFFDDKKESQKGDPNSLVAMFGEELNASVYKHFRINKVDILEDSVLPGTNKGNRLDRWILDKDNKILFQCEIKNWSASAIGGKQLKLNATDDEIKKIINHYWNRELFKSFSDKIEQPNNITKVLLKMKPPEKYSEGYKIEPLLIYWMPISTDCELTPLSTISIKTFNLPIKTDFENLTIFSVSLYLRQLYKSGVQSIDLEMPMLERRISTLNKLIYKS